MPEPDAVRPRDDLRRDLDVKLVAVAAEERLHFGDHLGDQRVDVHRLEDDLHPAGLDLRQVEDVVEQPQQVLARAPHPAEVVDHTRLPERLRVFGDDLGVPEDRVQRRAELVGHVGEEHRLRAARGFRVLLGALQLTEQVAVGGVVGVQEHADEQQHPDGRERTEVLPTAVEVGDG